MNALSEVGQYSKKTISKFIILAHNNALDVPFSYESDASCAIKYFIKSEITKSAWMKDCLSNSITQRKIENWSTFNMEKRNEIIIELKQHLGQDGKIRTLVHSIAKGNLKPMVANENPSLKNDDFILTINAMAISLYDWTQAIFEANLFAKDTRIISFTSEGNTKAWKHYAAVSAAKVTLEAITRNIALEFAPYGIRANCIQAGVTDTASLQLIAGSDKIKEHTLLRNPFKRLTTPEDVANVVYLLSKDEASWINGSIIPVDGGEHIS